MSNSSVGASSLLSPSCALLRSCAIFSVFPGSSLFFVSSSSGAFALVVACSWSGSSFSYTCPSAIYPIITSSFVGYSECLSSTSVGFRMASTFILHLRLWSTYDSRTGYVFDGSVGVSTTTVLLSTLVTLYGNSAIGASLCGIFIQVFPFDAKVYVVVYVDTSDCFRKRAS